jgi:hypothetical protein
MKAGLEDSPDERPEAASHLGERLKAALEPPPAAVERVVRRALAASPAAGRWRRLVVAAAGAALLATLLVAVLLQRPAGQSVPAVATAVATAPAAPRGAIEVRSAAGIVTARSPSGRLWIVGTNPRHSVAGSIIVVRRGGNR